jgi:hypothetical protein
MSGADFPWVVRGTGSAGIGRSAAQSRVFLGPGDRIADGSWFPRKDYSHVGYSEVGR